MPRTLKEVTHPSILSRTSVLPCTHSGRLTSARTRARTRRELNLLARHNEARNHIHGRWDTKESYQEGLSLLRPPTHRHPHADAHGWAGMQAKDGKDALWVQISRVQPPRDHKEEGESWHEKVRKHIRKHMNPFFSPLKIIIILRVTKKEERKKRKHTHTHTLCAAQTEVIFINKPSDNKHTHIKAFALPPSLLHAPPLP